MPPVAIARYLAANIRAQRAHLLLTQEQLAERVGLSLKHLQRIEAAKVDLTLSTVAMLATALRTTPDRLLLPAVLPPARRGRPRKSK